MPRGRRAAGKVKSLPVSAEQEKDAQVTELFDEVAVEAESPTGEDIEIEVSDEDLAEEQSFVEGSVVSSEDAEQDAIVAELEALKAESFDDDDADVENGQELATEVVGNLVKITYKGLRNGDRAPGTISLIVPDDGTAPDDPTASISSGTDYRLTKDVSVMALPEHADWLQGHPVWDIQLA